jgi:cobalt-zinc-cadmium efflux system membrane fusion protein
MITHRRLPKLAAWPLLAVLCAGCAGPKPDQPDRQQEKTRQDVVVLSPEQQARAGLVVEPVRRVRQPSFLTATGWLVARPGAEVAIKAPATGFLTLHSAKGEIEPGLVVEAAGQPLGEIQVLLSAREQADLVAAKAEADVLVRQSQTTLQIAEAQLKRVQQSEGAVPGTRVAQLHEKAEHARAAYEEALQRLPFLPKEPYGDHIAVKPVPIEAPLAGRVVTVHVRPGQFVVQGDGLWTIADWSALWVRVPVFELDLPQVDQKESAVLEVPGTAVRLTAKPVGAPQATLYGQRTVDLFYEVPNPSGALRVGQAVSVLLPTGRPADRLVVPRSAVLWDGMGDTWVYLRAETNTFRRQRVELGLTLKDSVEVTRGLEEGANLVTVGAEALYGQEFKGEIVGEDTD